MKNPSDALPRLVKARRLHKQAIAVKNPALTLMVIHPCTYLSVITTQSITWQAISLHARHAVRRLDISPTEGMEYAFKDINGRVRVFLRLNFETLACNERRTVSTGMIIHFAYNG